MGVAEHLLAAQHAVVAEHDVLARRAGRRARRGSRRATRRTGARRRACVLISSSSTMRPCAVSIRNIRPGLQAALGDDLGRVDVDDADLRRHHDEVVVGDPVPAGPQAVAVEHGADDRAVGERHAGRAVPRLHHAWSGTGRRRAAPASISSLFSHASGIIISTAWWSGRPPRWSSSSTSSKRAVSDAPGVQIGNARSRPGSVELVDHRLAGAHPVLVALHRVDLAVVGDVAVRVGQRPRRERVRREAGVHEQQRALDSARR